MTSESDRSDSEKKYVEYSKIKREINFLLLFLCSMTNYHTLSVIKQQIVQVSPDETQSIGRMQFILEALGRIELISCSSGLLAQVSSLWL